MKVATWNLDQATPNATKANRQLEFVRDIDADVWVFTESFRDCSPGKGFSCIACSQDAPDRDSVAGAVWVAIWLRLPAESLRLKADLERVAAIKIKQPDDRDVVVVGMVLPWPSDHRDADLSGSAAFQARLAEQSSDWKRLGAEYGGRLCVMGDFNQDLLPTGHYFHSHDSRIALRATLNECGLRCLTGGVDDPLTTVADLASIDHICIGRGLSCGHSPPSSVWPRPGTLAKNLSDHYGVCAAVETA